MAFILRKITVRFCIIMVLGTIHMSLEVVSMFDGLCVLEGN